MIQGEKEKFQDSSQQQSHLQEQYLRALESEDVPVGIVILEGEKRLISFVNPVISRLWGRTKAEVLNRPLFEAIPELGEQVFKDLLHGVYTTGIPYFGTEVPAVFIIDGKKETVYFNFVYSPIHNEKGTITGIFVTAIDVTAQVQAKRQAAEEQKRLYDFLQQSPSAIAVLRGKELMFELANELYQKIVGKTQEQLLGQPGRKALPELNAQGIWDIFDRVYNTGVAFYGNEFPAQLDRLGDGTLDQGYFNFVAQPVKNERGEVERIFIHAYEVTFQVLARKKVEESITAMKKLEQQKDEFLAVASHELKTPVTSIKAYTQVLQKLFKNKGDMQSSELLAKMDGQINKLIALIADLLDISKMQAGKLQLRLNKFGFDELVTEVVDEVQRTATHHTIQIEQIEGKFVYGNRDRIGQVIMNLLTNAVKYSPDADSVIVKTRVDQETITLCVQDFGVGIPQEKQAKVFEQFYRVEGGKENIYPGLGLGLYISNEIIRRHGGIMWVESEEGKGSTFCFTIPTQERALQQPEESLDEETVTYE